MDNKTPREVLSGFYADNHLGQDGGQSSSSVKIELSPKFHFYFPNIDARRKAVVKHDIHHLLTNYNTTVSGESEISAWEIGSGCRKYWAAFLIDTSGVMLGIPFNFLGVLRAFARGRMTKNLYHDQFSTEEALDMKIADLRSRLDLDKYTQDTKPRFIDVILFLLFAFFGGIYSLLSLVLLPLIIVYTVFIALGTKKARRS